MEEFIPVKFSAELDSKGRITVPARIRNRLELEQGDRISVQLESGKVLKKEFSSKGKALEFLSGLENIKGFSFSFGTLEVVLDE